MVGVAGQDDACRQWNGLAGKAVWIAAAVPAFVLGPDHRRKMGETVHRRDDLLPDLRVAAHLNPLLRGQPPRLALQVRERPAIEAEASTDRQRELDDGE